MNVTVFAYFCKLLYAVITKVHIILSLEQMTIPNVVIVCKNSTGL